MGKEASDVRVVDCRIFENGPHTGVIVLTETRRFFIVANIAANSVVLRSMGEIPGMAAFRPSCWTVVCQDRDVQVFLAKDSELFAVDKAGHFQQVYKKKRKFSWLRCTVLSADLSIDRSMD